MRDPRRTGGDTDDGWCIHRRISLVFLRDTVQRIKQILCRLSSHNAFPEGIIGQARRQRRQHLDMRGSRFSWRDGKQDDQLYAFRAVHPLPLQRFAQRSNRKSRFVHRVRFTMRDSQPFTQRGWSLRFATVDLRQKCLAIGNFAQRHQPHCKLANGLITAGIVCLHADSTGVGQGRQVHKILTHTLLLSGGNCGRSYNTFM